MNPAAASTVCESRTLQIRNVCDVTASIHVVHVTSKFIWRVFYFVDIQNGFRMHTPRRDWVCSADTDEDKVNWITLLEDTVRSALDVD